MVQITVEEKQAEDAGWLGFKVSEGSFPNSVPVRVRAHGWQNAVQVEATVWTE